MGAIQDRSHEHLAKSDAGIRAYRTLLLKAIEAVEAGEAPAVGASSVPSEAPIAVDAIAAFRSDSVFREALGTSVSDYLLTIKEAEVARFLSEVTDWEQREYFSLY